MHVSFKSKRISKNKFLVTFFWLDEKTGFGQINMVDDKGKITMDTEYMSKEFVKKVINQLVDDAEIVQ
jgi:hypothetical protein